MKMVIGGAWQGQLGWAELHYGKKQWIDGNNCSFKAIDSCEGIYDFQMYIKRVLQTNDENDIRIEDLVQRLIRKNPDIIIVSNEIGYGLVPVDAFERKYREMTGRICTELAAFSDEVVRVVMGIGTVLKSHQENFK